MAWNEKMRWRRSSSKNEATFLPSLPKPPMRTSCRPALHGFTRSSTESKLASMNALISAS